VLYDLGDLAAARAAIEQALAIWKPAYGEEHPQVGTAQNNLGMVLEELGDLAGAQAAFERALTIFEHSLPPDHPNIAAVRRNLEAVMAELREQECPS
jgi:tetratricopeptide (TPR) repeat protein